MADSVYKVIELVGTSTESWEKAATVAVERASQSLRDLRVAEVVELKFLYVLENGSHVVSGWRVGTDGSLVSIGEFGPIPAGAAGIAAY
jgi:flavin-binding protein dodecin